MCGQYQATVAFLQEKKQILIEMRLIVSQSWLGHFGEQRNIFPLPRFFSLYVSDSSAGAIALLSVSSIPWHSSLSVSHFLPCCLSCSTTLTYLVTDVHIMLIFACYAASRFRHSTRHTMLPTSALSEAPKVTVLLIIDRPALDVVAKSNSLSRIPGSAASLRQE